MYHFPIGIIIDCFREEFSSALKKAADLGAKGIQMYATYGEHSPRELTADKRKDLLNQVKSNGLCFSAICGDLGQGFSDKIKNPLLIETSKRIMDLAMDLETNIVTTHIGVVPTDKSHDRYKIMQEACAELADYADSIGAHFAVETGPERAIVLKEFLDSLNSRGVSVNLDPANLVMVTGDDPVQAVYTLKDYIVHTHAKDGIKLFDKDPEIIYGMVEEEIKSGTSFKEMPLGQGNVDFDRYLHALYDIGYRGFLTIEREVGEDVTGDIRTAVNFLTSKMNER